MNIFSHSITPSDIVHKVGVKFDSDFNVRRHISLTCRSRFYHIRDFRRIPLSVAKAIATALITSRLDYCNSLYNIASKDILKLQCVQDCLARVVTRSPRFSHSVPLLKSLHWLPVQSYIIFKLCSVAYQSVFFWRTFISIFHAFFSTQAQGTSFIE